MFNVSLFSDFWNAKCIANKLTILLGIIMHPAKSLVIITCYIHIQESATWNVYLDLEVPLNHDDIIKFSICNCELGHHEVSTNLLSDLQS